MIAKRETYDPYDEELALQGIVVDSSREIDQAAELLRAEIDAGNVRDSERVDKSFTDIEKRMEERHRVEKMLDEAVAEGDAGMENRHLSSRRRGFAKT